MSRDSRLKKKQRKKNAMMMSSMMSLSCQIRRTWYRLNLHTYQIQWINFDHAIMIKAKV